MATCAVACQAGPVDDAIIAAMSLSENPDYSWRSSVTDDVRTYEIEGKTVPAGWTWQRQPMPDTIARRLGRGASYELEAIFKDTHTYVIRTDDGWRQLEELPKRHPDWHGGVEWIYVTQPLGPTPDMPADAWQYASFGLPQTIAIPVIRQQQEEGRAYSNAQFALALPHRELEVIVSSCSSFESDGTTAHGTLTDFGAQLLLVHEGHEYIQPVTAAGRFTLWIQDGVVARYKIELEGILEVDGKQVFVRQSSNTTVSKLGETSFYIPGDALRRLLD